MRNRFARRLFDAVLLTTFLVVAAPAHAAGIGIWIAPSDLNALPMSGAAWTGLLAEANLPTGVPNLADQDSNVDVRVMAKALVYARTGTDSYRQDVLAAIQTVTYGNTEAGGRTLAVCRGLAAYVLAADLVGLPAQLDTDFRAFLVRVRTEDLSGSTIISTHENRPNNWGLHCGCSRAAVARYLGDTADLDRTIKVFKGWLGDRGLYSAFTYGSDLTWQVNPSLPVGINPPGSVKEGHDIDGVLPDDQRRAGSFAWPPTKTVYSWGVMGAVLGTAVILDRAGHHEIWNFQNKAILRAVDWLHRTTFDDGLTSPAVGDDTWQPHVINHYYGTSYPAPSPSRPGKNVGWTDWTHGNTPIVDLDPPSVPTNFRRSDVRAVSR